MRNVVITGTGCICPLGRNKNDIVNKLKTGSEGYIKEGFFRIPEEILQFERINKTGEISVDIAQIAFLDSLHDAGLKINDIPDNSMVVFSSSKGGLNSLFSACFDKTDIDKKIMNYLPCSALQAVCALIQKPLPAVNVISACSTGLYSIIQAYHAIKEGAELAVAGTTESSIIPVIVNGFKNMKVISQEKIRPFDKNRTGFIMGEGAGCLILEEEERALARNANIYARITGFGRNTDINHATALSVKGEPIAAAIINALQNDYHLDWINAHGTATRLNDEAEYNAFNLVFNENIEHIPVNSFKPYIGHLLGASSTIETIFILYCMQENFIPGNITLESPEYALYLSQERIDKILKRVLKLSHGFGGHIGALVLEK